ncbi:MAG: hypothetical protein GXP45_08150 [bacterium]|nr:hypothetical protein [bacterium]
MPQEKILFHGHFENIGEKQSLRTHNTDGKQEKINQKIKNHKQAFVLLLKKIHNTTDIDKVGHRVVHGGEQYQKIVKINQKVLDAIDQNSLFAPLHNPHNKR